MLSKEIINKLSKVELHCHLDGSLSLSCIKKLAQMAKIDLPKTDAEILEKAQAPESTRDLIEYLARFDFVLPLLQTFESLELAAFDVARQAAEDNIKYIEIRFAPNLHLKRGLSLTETVEAVIKGLVRAEKEFDIQANVLVCGLRHEEESQMEKLLEIFEVTSDKHLVGFDLAGDEVNFPQKNFANLLRKVRNKGIHITLHAGECPYCEENIVSSVQMGARRIGHGVMIKDLPDFWDELVEKKIVLEMAPTSNFQTHAIESLAEYPFKKLYDAGVHVTINTDNRTVSNTNLCKEYEKIAQWYDFQVGDFLKVNQYAIDGAFVPESKKEELQERFLSDYGKFS